MNHSPLEEPALTGWHAVDQVLHLPGSLTDAAARWKGVKGTLAAAVGLLVARYQGSESVVMSVPGSDDTDTSEGRRIRINDQLSIRDFVQDFQRHLEDGDQGADEPELIEEGEVRAEVDWPVALYLIDDPSAMETVRRSLPDDLSFGVTAYPSEEGLAVRVFVREGRIEEWMVGPMAGHLGVLWKQMNSSDDVRVADLGMLTDEEFQKTVLEWNDTGVEEPVGTSIPDRFEENMADFGDSVAVVDGERTLTYSQLRSKANRLAHYLKKLGAGHDVPVGVFLERSIDLVVGITGLHRAGAAYMPLDPGYPSDRLRYQVEDSEVPIIVTNSRLAANLPSENVRLVLVDEEAEAIAAEPDDAMTPGFKVGNVSNVFYTSGSTGKPKGVLMRYSRMTPRREPQKKPRRVEPGQGMLLKSPVGFTLILLEVNGAINSGGRLVVIPDGKEKDPSYMIRMIREHQVASAGLVPSMLDLLLDDPEVRECTTLKTIHTVGESLPIEVQERFFRKLPEAKLIVYYGCTEAPAATTRVVSADDDFGRRIVIGKPAGGKRVYILDKNRIPLPIGVSGEIYIGGSLSKGYLNRDGLTSERFQDDPFSPHPNARVYRTGDLGRWLPDGNLEILGRTDFQVQVRGVRIELGEIEEVLRSHVSIRDAIIHPDQKGGQTRLYAYVTPNAEGPVPIGELRALIRDRLPEYMMPAAIIEMKVFPLNAAGKIDRMALPKPEKIERTADTDYTGPRTPSEIRLCAMWAQLLGVDRVGIEDDFLELGGDSFLAVRLLGQIQSEFGKRFELPDLFSDPRVVALAALVDGKRMPTNLKWLIPTRFFDDAPPTHTFTGSFVFAYVTTKMMEGMRLKFPVYSISIDWKYSNMDYSEGVEALAAHHLDELKKIDPEGPYRFAGYSFGGLVAFEMARQIKAEGGSVAFLVLLDPTPPFGSQGSSEAAFLEGERARKRAPQGGGVAAKIRKVPPGNRLAWLWARRRGVLNVFRKKLTGVLQVLVVRGLWPGKKIPEALRGDWATLYKLAIWRRYIPGIYDGDVTVFTTEGRDQVAAAAWAKVVKGRLDTRALPVRTHDDVLKEPEALDRISSCLSDKLGEERPL